MSDTISTNAAQIAATKPAQARTDLPSDDTVTLIVGGQRLQNWTNVTISIGIEHIPPMCELHLTFASQTPVKIDAFAPCEVYIGKDKLITGYIRRSGLSYSARSHEVTIEIGGKTMDLLDCSAIMPSGTQLASGLLAGIATDLCKPFGISVVAPNPPVSSIPPYPIALTERVWDILDGFARYCARIIFEDSDGNLVITEVGKTKMASGILQGVNVERASSSLDGSIRYSDYKAALASTDSLVEEGLGNLILKSDFRDSAVTRYRPLVIVSGQSNLDGQLAIQLAKWEASRRAGRSQALQVVVSGWRDSSGKLWAINTLIDIKLPAVNVLEKTWLIAAVTFSTGLDGTHANMQLMPPEAFTPSPSALFAVGADINNQPTTTEPQVQRTQTTGHA